MAEKTENGIHKNGFRFKYVFYIVVILLLILAVFSHSAQDLAVLEGGSDASLQNWIGPVGAHTSRILFYLFGIAIYPVIILFIVCVIRPFLPFPTERRGYIGALTAMVLGITILFAMWPSEFRFRTEILGIGHSTVPDSALSGGVIGQQLAAPESHDIDAGIIRRYIGTIGSLITALVFLLTGAFFVWLADWKVICVHLLTKNRDIGKPLKTRYQEEEEKTIEDTGSPDIGMMGRIELKKGMENPKIPETIEEAEKAEPEEGPVVEPVSLASLKKQEVPEKEFAPPPSRQKTVAAFDPNYVLPPVSLLEKVKECREGEKADIIDRTKAVLQQTLESFNIDGQVTGIVPGPRVTRFEITLSPGVNINKVTNISGNIAMNLEAESIRILAPIPGKNAVGVEAPNSKASAVYMRTIMEADEWRNSPVEIPIVLGKNVAGEPVILDLAKAPHLLIAGATGSGKSVCMNTLIMSLLFKYSPSDLRLILADPKVVELEVYSPLPHLITPVVNDPQKLTLALRWAVSEMEKRYRMMAKVKSKNLAGFNSRPIPAEPVFDSAGNEIPKKLPIIVIIVDELADVMMTDSKSDVETAIARIAQKGRASGIHIVIATQRPSTNIITGVIKANLPTRIAFKVGSGVDSRVILDQNGAETLLGRGDMLFVPPGSANIERIQGAMVSDPDIQKVVDFVGAQAEQQFDNKVIAENPGEDDDDDNVQEADDGEETISATDPLVKSMLAKYSQPGDDENVRKSLEILFTERKISTSYIQRRMGIGYNKAAEIMDIFEKRGIVSAPLPGGSKRDILVFDEIENS
ncbi:MAG: hypothetical protein A2017_22350 [Lentisphaerae bacterium GWF2_44_16]|nr:MAG: hypothetical protein A2017_22350 [Lentisphaerae bacterium GWF2_44_16]